jgi:hypothetical protein
LYRGIIRNEGKGRFKSAGQKERTQIVQEVIDDVKNKGYIFVDKDEETNVWKNMDTKSVVKKIRIALQKAQRGKGTYKVTGKRKTDDTTTHNNSECGIASNPVETNDGDEDASATSDDG